MQNVETSHWVASFGRLRKSLHHGIRQTRKWIVPFAHVHSRTFASVPRTATGVHPATCQRQINAPGQGSDILPASDRSMTDDSAACDQLSCRASACTNIHQDVLHRIEIQRSRRSFTAIAAPAGVQRSHCFRKRKNQAERLLRKGVMHA